MLKIEDWPSLEKLTALRKLEHDGPMRRASILPRELPAHRQRAGGRAT